MPGPILGDGRTFEVPPSTGNAVFDEYMFLLHARIFGIGTGTKGDLDLDNINPEIIPDVTAEQAATHTSLVQGTRVASFTIDDELDATTISVDFTDLSGTGHPNIESAVNELKADVNNLITEYNVTLDRANDIMDKVDSLLASLRAGHLIAT